MTRQKFITILVLVGVGCIAASWIPTSKAPRYESLDILGPAQYSSVDGLRCEELPVDDLVRGIYREELRPESKEVTSHGATKVCQMTSGSPAEPGRLRITVQLYETPAEAYHQFAARQDEVPSENGGQFRSTDPGGATILLHNNASVTVTPTTEFAPGYMDMPSDSYFMLAGWVLEEL